MYSVYVLKCKYSNIYDFVQRHMGKSEKKPQKIISAA